MSLFVRDYSDPDADMLAIPLVVIHGLFGSGDNWQTIAKEIGKDRRCYALDLPSHGESPWGGSLRYDAIAGQIADTIETLGLKKIAIMGHSMGGKSAMALALLFPDLVVELIVVDIAPKRYKAHHDDIFAALEAIDPRAIAQRSHADTIMAQYVLDPMMRGFLLKNLRPQPEGGYAWRFDYRNIQKEYDHIVEWLPEFDPVRNSLTKYPTYTGPVFFIGGAQSDFIDRDLDLPTIHSLFPAARLSFVENARHWVHADNKPGFVAQLKAILI